jgi:hypothetical protein
MPGVTPIYGFPYPEPSDLVANYPALGQQLAEDVEAEIAASSKILQVLSLTFTNTFTTTSTSFTDITNFNLSITPATNTNKILVLCTVTGTGTNVESAGPTGVVLLRNSTQIAVGVGGGAQFSGQLSNRLVGAGAHTLNTAWNHLDSPATTSAVTYKIQGRAAAGTLYINRDVDDTRSVSTLTLVEVSA